jgi:hypothetical protein
MFPPVVESNPRLRSGKRDYFGIQLRNPLYFISLRPCHKSRRNNSWKNCATPFLRIAKWKRSNFIDSSAVAI